MATTTTRNRFEGVVYGASMGAVIGGDFGDYFTVKDDNGDGVDDGYLTSATGHYYLVGRD